MVPPTLRNKKKKTSPELNMDENKHTPVTGATATANIQADDPNENRTDGLLLSPEASTVAAIVANELSTANLSGEMLTLVNIISKIIQTKLDTHFDKIAKSHRLNEVQIAHLESKVSALENKIIQLESTIDDVDQYERRDTVIISGPSLPEESNTENPAEIIVTTIKNQLHTNISLSDINVAHRIGKKLQGTKRPIIVKLQKREKKAELIQACITVRPPLHINESLTPSRRKLFTIIRKVRQQHRNIFQQCYTSDGKIIVKLFNSNTKYTITSEQSLTAFLDKHPILKSTASSITLE